MPPSLTSEHIEPSCYPLDGRDHGGDAVIGRDVEGDTGRVDVRSAQLLDGLVPLGRIATPSAFAWPPDSRFPAVAALVRASAGLYEPTPTIPAAD